MGEAWDKFSRGTAKAALYGLLYWASFILMVSSYENHVQLRDAAAITKYHNCERHGPVAKRRVGVQLAPVRKEPSCRSPIIKKAKYFEELEMLDYYTYLDADYLTYPGGTRHGVHEPSVQLKKKDYKNLHWERVSIGEQEGWIFRHHTMSYFGGPDRHLEWDIERPDKTLLFLQSNRYLRLEDEPKKSGHDVAKPYSTAVDEAADYNDKLAVHYIESMLLSNIKNAGGANLSFASNAIEALAKLGEKSSIMTLYNVIDSYSGIFEDSTQEHAANAILKLVQRDHRDFQGYAEIAAREILRNQKYTKECKKTAGNILAAIGKE